MKIAIDKGLLVSTLDKALKAVIPKSTMQILEGVLLEAEDGFLKITGNNMEIGIQAKCECEVIKPGKVVVNAKLFSDVVRKLEGELDITMKDLTMIIEGENSSVKIKGLETSGYPALPILNAKDSEVVEIQQKELKDLINKTVFAVSTDPQRAPLNGEHIKISNGFMNGISSDGVRVAIRRVETDANAEFEAIIIGKILSDISKILDNDGVVKIYKNRNQMMFETDRYLITSRTLTGEYFDFSTFITNDYATRAEVKTKELRNALESVFPFVPSSDMSKSPPLIIAVEYDKVKVKYASEIGESNSEIYAKVEGVDAKHGFNPRFILDALKAIDDEFIVLQFLGEMKPLFIVPNVGNDFFHMCAPVKIVKG